MNAPARSLQVDRHEPHAAIRSGGIELIEQLAPEWIALLASSRKDEPFYRPEWISAYLRAFQPEGELLLAEVRSGEQLKAVLPLVKHRARFCGFPVRQLSAAQNVHSCRFDLVMESGENGEQAVGAIWRALSRLSDWDLIALRGVPDGGAAELLLQAARKEGFPTGRWASMRNPYIPLADVKDAAQIPASTHFRQNLRRRIRKVQAHGALRLSRIDQADRAALDRFFALERSGWKGAMGTAIECDESTRRFYDEIARAGERFGYFTLYLLELGPELIAGHYGLTYKGRYYTPKVAYDEKYSNFGPGHIIVDAVLRECLQRGLREFDFLGPWMEWKAEWARQTHDLYDCYIFRRGLFGKALHSAKFEVMSRLRPIARIPQVARIRQQWHSLRKRNA